jgi:hypothetical protein
MSLVKWQIRHASKATRALEYVTVLPWSVETCLSTYFKTKLRNNVLSWKPTSLINDYTFSLVFWVEEPERSLYRPFFHMWMMVRRPNERAPVDFRTFRTDRNDDSKWQVAVSHCSSIHLYGSHTFGVAITSNTLVEDPYQNLYVLVRSSRNPLPVSRVQDALSYIGQNLTLKGVNVGTVDGDSNPSAA